MSNDVKFFETPCVSPNIQQTICEIVSAKVSLLSFKYTESAQTCILL